MRLTITPRLSNHFNPKLWVQSPNLEGLGVVTLNLEKLEYVRPGPQSDVLVIAGPSCLYLCPA